MGKVDFALQEKASLHTTEMSKALADIDSKFVSKAGSFSVEKMDTDLEAWLEVFKEDEVKHEGCH